MSSIIRTEVESSNLHSVGYDPERRILEIQFKTGRGDKAAPGATYRYFDVSKAVFDDLMKSDSKGKYFASHIKGTFRYERA